MTIILIALQQIRLLLKNPAVVLLFLAAPLFMIFVFGQAFTGVFVASGAPLRALDYFGVTLFTMAVVQGTFIASWGVFKEQKNNTRLRLRLAPLSNVAVVFGLFLGSWLILLVLSAIVLLLSAVLLSVNYGSSPAALALPLLALTLLASASGISAATLLGSERAAGGLLNTFVPLLVFLGGGYFMIPETGWLHSAARFSPLRWVNLALLEVPRSGFSQYTLPAVIFCTAAALLLLLAAGLKAARSV
ncbi:MAG: ABC transporter permease [Spirochaetes bacterium]|nr:ABC transporter permease [Spirochaetota bacterium]MBU0955998.1 ABC transporter permease [Spirochaetota bacterium]